MRLAGLLGDKEGIDSPGFADQGDVGVDALGNGFQESEIGRAGQVPILGISHYEIENVLASRKLNHSGVTHSGAHSGRSDPGCRLTRITDGSADQAFRRGGGAGRGLR